MDALSTRRRRLRNEVRMSSRNFSLMVLVGAIVGFPLGSEAWAAGFAVHEQSAASQGNAYAGVAAGGSDISSSYFNPATLTLFPGKQVAGSFALIFGRANLDIEKATTVVGNPVGGCAPLSLRRNWRGKQRIGFHSALACAPCISTRGCRVSLILGH